MEQLLLCQEDNLEKLSKAVSNYKKSPKQRITRTYIETKIESLEKIYEQFNDSHNKIISQVKKESKFTSPYFANDWYTQFVDEYEEYKTKLKDDLLIYTTSDTLPMSSAIASGSVSSGEIKLPRIQLPTFSGNYDDWQMFYDMFISLIHNNVKLSAVQKLHYLKSSLSGEPENLLRNLPTTESNYDDAWKQLNRRYNNKRYNANEILKRLFTQKYISFESASGTKHLLDTTVTCLKSLNNLGVHTESWDAIIVHMTTSKLDPESRRQWEVHVSSVESDDLPTWKQLEKFLENRFRTLEMIDTTKGKTLTVNSGKTISKPKLFHTTLRDYQLKNRISCTLCSGAHLLYQCEQFGNQSPEERVNYIQTKGLCFNCFGQKHTVKQCHQSTCCRKCGRRHHTLLHFERNRESTISPENSQALTSEKVVQSTQNESSTETRVAAHFAREEEPHHEQVLLATASVQAKSRNGCTHYIRALLDQGSQASFVTESTVQLLGIKRVPVSGIVSCIGDSEMSIKNMVTLTIQSRHDADFSIRVNAYVMSSLTSLIPTREIEKSEWLDIETLPLADPNFGSPGRIHILLGAEIYSQILLDGLICNPNGGTIAQNTRFGWILSGRIKDTSKPINNIINMHLRIREDQLLRQFWEIESEPDMIQKKMTAEEIKCEEIYESTTERDKEGRYIVRLPLRDENSKYLSGESRRIAQHRFNLLEKRLQRKVDLKEEYRKVILEYLELNHMEEIVEERDINNPTVIYLPHHAVVKEDRDTTKVRVVFDASCKNTNNVSLNESLLIGPKLQDDLRHILMRWRCHRFSLIADIVKMYRQVRVHPDDTDYQRLLWRSNPNELLHHYRLLRLTFGTACAPYLAIKTLQQLAKDEETNYPIAATIAKRDFYVDDLMTGCNTEDEAIEIYKEMGALMKAGGFDLQKWRTNSKKLLDFMKNEKESLEKQIPIKENDMVKVLGIAWNKNSDNFEYTISLPNLEHPVTKRNVLSNIARIYDPLGWIGPITVTGKIFMQKLWKSGLNWDDELTSELLSEWIKFRNDIHNTRNIVIPRWINRSKSSQMQLHAFGDASTAAYAAVVYSRVIDADHRVQVHLITAKTKVAPAEKELSVPRLELCAALLATKLLHEVSQILIVSKENLYAWTDSTVVLAWLNGLPSRWSTFVSNRVSDILNILEFSQWNHVETSDNPADAASRGMSAQSLMNYKLWWKGPDWLTTNFIPKSKMEFCTDLEERTIKVVAATTAIQNEEFLWNKFSSLPKMLRIMSYCKRVFNQTKPLSIVVDPIEREIILEMCLRQCQQFHFNDEIKLIQANRTVSQKSPLHILNPFIDDKGILRVGGRIDQAHINYDKRRPIIMPCKSHLTKLIIMDSHVKTLHGGPQIMLNHLRSKYWILRAREQVKRIYRECIRCVRYSKLRSSQLMGQLPEVRIVPSRPFKASGVDFTGYINIRFSPGRGAKSCKGYVCLFICMSTRAIHLEAVSDLSAQGFIAAFRRFVSRRGRCTELFSDNGTNFVGACKILRDNYLKAKSHIPCELEHLLADEGTSWHFIPPHAPNFGGLWEAGVRSTKHHLKRVIGESTLTFEELATVLAEIEACLNSRPMSHLSDNIDDPVPLTPGHFLIGEPLVTIPNENFSQSNMTGLTRWRLTQKMVSDFWKRWADEYLVTLNQRNKWRVKKPEPVLNDVVLIREDNLPPGKWLLGRVIQKHPGKDDVTRVVSLKTKHGVVKRPCNKLCLLPINN